MIGELVGLRARACDNGALEQIHIKEAIDAHVRWKVGFQNFLDGNPAPGFDPRAKDIARTCELGVWLHGAANAHLYGRSTEAVLAYHRLRADHEHFHHVAELVVEKLMEHNRDAAMHIMQTQYAKASRKVVLALFAVSRAVHASSDLAHAPYQHHVLAPADR